MPASAHRENTDSVQVRTRVCCLGRIQIILNCCYLILFRHESVSCLVAGHSSLSFSGNSYIKYRLYDLLQSEMKVSLRVRTLQSQGIIMFTKTEPCMVLKVGTHAVTLGFSVLIMALV